MLSERTLLEQTAEDVSSIGRSGGVINPLVRDRARVARWWIPSWTLRRGNLHTTRTAGTRAAIGPVELSEETRAILKETEGELERGESVSHEDLKRELGLD